MNIVKVEYTIAEQQGFDIYKAEDVYNVLKDRFNPLQEEFYLLPVVQQEFCIERLFIGGLGQAITDPKTIFHLLLTKYPNCPSFIIAHNHPSGTCDPSDSDRLMTEKLKQASDFMGYTLMDHIIFSNRGFYSFNNKGDLL